MAAVGRKPSQLQLSAWLSTLVMSPDTIFLSDIAGQL